jgi:ATP-dependent DNA helicase RecQ
MTRAKENLSIHYNGDYFTGYSAAELEYNHDNTRYNEPDLISIQLTHHDTNLGYFRFVRNRIDGITAGQKIMPGKEECKNLKGETVLKFSKHFQEKVGELENRGYKLNDARVKFILYWFDKEAENESLIVLPEVTFKKIL